MSIIPQLDSPVEPLDLTTDKTVAGNDENSNKIINEAFYNRSPSNSFTIDGGRDFLRDLRLNNKLEQHSNACTNPEIHLSKRSSGFNSQNREVSIYPTDSSGDSDTNTTVQGRFTIKSLKTKLSSSNSYSEPTNRLSRSSNSPISHGSRTTSLNTSPQRSESDLPHISPLTSNKYPNSQQYTRNNFFDFNSTALESYRECLSSKQSKSPLSYELEGQRRPMIKAHIFYPGGSDAPLIPEPNTGDPNTAASRHKQNYPLARPIGVASSSRDETKDLGEPIRTSHSMGEIENNHVLHNKDYNGSYTNLSSGSIKQSASSINNQCLSTPPRTSVKDWCLDWSPDALDAHLDSIQYNLGRLYNYSTFNFKSYIF